jgi:hypothetical protein
VDTVKIHLGVTPIVFDRLPGVPVRWKRGAGTGQNSIHGLAGAVAAMSSGKGDLQSGAARTAMVRAQLARMVARSPQVMVKVTGRQNGAAHVLANFQYIAGKEGREGRDEGIETQDGEVVKDPKRMKEIADEWDKSNLAAGERRIGASARHRSAWCFRCRRTPIRTNYGTAYVRSPWRSLLTMTG